MKTLRLIYWKIIDIYRYLKKIYNKEEILPHLFGIRGYFGLPGKGKTMALVNELETYRKKYADKVYITTNFNYLNQDFEFESWEQLLEVYDKPLVVAWDEVQNEFNSRDFKNFPTDLLTLLTQNRKGNGIQILYTAQRYNRVDKVFRELTHYAVSCNTILGRLTKLRYYHWEDYEQLHNLTNVDMKVKIRPIKTISFIQTDDIRNLYDSYKMLESAKSKKYMTRKEISLLKNV